MRSPSFLLCSPSAFTHEDEKLKIHKRLQFFRDFCVNLFPEHEIDGGDKAEEGGSVVPMEVFALEHEGGDDSEDSQGDDFLNHHQLDEGVRTSVANETEFVGWHLQGVLKEGDAP